MKRTEFECVCVIGLTEILKAISRPDFDDLNGVKYIIENLLAMSRQQTEEPIPDTQEA